MAVMTKDECPSFLGKWQPNQLVEVIDTDSFFQTYYFDFALLNVTIQRNRASAQYEVNSTGTMHAKEYNADTLFDERISEMFRDCKAAVADIITELAKANPELGSIDIDDYANFTRTTGFSIQVDDESHSIMSEHPSYSERLSAIHKIIAEVYDSLEDAIRGRFGIVGDDIFNRFDLWSKSEKDKTLYLGKPKNEKGTYFSTENPLHEVGPLNAGMLYFHVISGENANKAYHDEVVAFCRNHLLAHFGDKLIHESSTGHVAPIGLTGDGACWKIDLSPVKILDYLPKDQELRTIAPYLKALPAP